MVGLDQHHPIAGPQLAAQEGAQGGDRFTDLPRLEMGVVDVDHQVETVLGGPHRQFRRIVGSSGDGLGAPQAAIRMAVAAMQCLVEIFMARRF